MSLRRTATLALLTLSLASAPGCVFAAAGLGAAYYYTSSADAEISATPQDVIAAAQSVMEEMELRVESSRASALDGYLLARTAKDDRVNIKVSSKTEGQSQVTVRVGLTDERAAQRILDGIVARLQPN